MIDKKSLLKKEFYTKGNLIDYKDVIEILIDKILDSNCLISACDTCETSGITETKDITKKNHIRISFKYKREKPLHLIWDILHEFGHHLSGHPNGLEKSLERERLAWDYGKKILSGYPTLKENEQDYEEYRDNCLKSYNT